MLSDTKARQAKPTDKVYRIADAKGLALEVRPSGQKFWRYRFRFDRKPSMFTIGEYPSVGLIYTHHVLLT
ncbi:Arm DNA-binding domain-containing protein [Chromobacterium vaccinii]|uniref:Arm DNA-binding domain-containing protein n=1 Tax=Chromobacterium vaccinii TaxID=1108595 RepID=UPI000E2044D2|nr:Arm DNA-binding domain-containing protein [Chromobacterium vaccinii]